MINKAKLELNSGEIKILHAVFSKHFNPEARKTALHLLLLSKMEKEQSIEAIEGDHSHISSKKSLN